MSFGKIDCFWEGFIIGILCGAIFFAIIMSIFFD